jgi:hypothetical protein
MDVNGLKATKNRDNEKGAAMVMALMVSFLLLVASAGILLESALNTQNVSDATGEQQAYNAAESGIQSAINVLRGNVAPNPLLDATKPATDPANRISFVRALKLNTSNLAGDGTTQPRLSRWMSYDGTCNTRVVLGTNGCSNATGYGFSVSISDPDNTGSQVSYTTVGRFFDSDTLNPTQKTYGSGANRVIVQYTPVAVTDLNVTSGATNTNFGTFTLSIQGTGAAISAFNRFEIEIRMTKPYVAKRVIRGYIETNTSGTANPPKIIFDAQTFTLVGSTMTLNFAWGSPSNVGILGPPQRYGYEATLVTGANIVTGSITSPEPTRLVIRSTGFGPRGAEKRLDAIIQKDSFNGLTAPATLTLVGPPSTTSPATTFMFNPGSSNVTVYSGDDVVSTDIIPPIGTTNPDNLNDVEDSVAGEPPHPFNGTVVGSPSDISNELPDWLASPSALDATIHQLANVARSSGRFYASGVQPTTFGDNTTGQGITFCDGNCTFTGAGGGIMIVTGKLTLHGNFNFNGLILVTGQAGVDRSGGGNGTIQGNIVVSPYVGSRVEDGVSPASTATFLSPQYDLSGGGNSTVIYNSNSVAGGMIAVSNYVLGVVEK